MMTTEFDQVFNQMEAPEYPATCDNCGEVGTNASMEQHDCSEHHDAPAVPERGDRWHADSSGGWGYVWQDRACLAQCPEPSRAQQIVTEHNQHSTLIAQRERLLHTLRAASTTLKSYQYGNVSPELAKEMIRTIEQVITTSEQEGRRAQR